MKARWLLALALAGCKPDLGGSAALVDAPRVLAIRSTPAEAPVGADVVYEALVAAPSGGSLHLQWALCNERPTLAEPGSLSPACLTPAADFLTDLGEGAQAHAALPADACRTYGPDGPAARPGEPPGRPTDPDLTGGYYQPVRVQVRDGADATYAAGSTRLQCSLAGATGEQLKVFADGYRANENPAPTALSLVAGDTATALDASPVAAGSTVTLRLSWPSCPATASCGDGVCAPSEQGASCPADCATPRGCPGSETYLLFVPDQRQLTERRESLVISWFATSGRFASERTGRDGDDLASESDNAWTAPATPGPVQLWAVLRDERGGVGWLSATVTVR